MLRWLPAVMVAVSAVSTEAHRVLAQPGPAERPAVLAPAAEVVQALGPGLPHSGHSQGAELRASGRVHTGTHVCRMGMPTLMCTHVCRVDVHTLMHTCL